MLGAKDIRIAARVRWYGFADINTMSSYNRVGLTLKSSFQPGFRGCVSLELFNHSNNPIELVVGRRLVQAGFFMLKVVKVI